MAEKISAEKIVTEIFGLEKTKEQAEKENPEEIEGAVKWDKSDRELYTYKAEAGKVKIYAKAETKGNQVFCFEVLKDKGIYFKLITEDVHEIRQIDDYIIGFAISRSGPIHAYSLIREDDNIYFKETISLIPDMLPKRVGDIICSYKIQLKDVKYYELKTGEIVFYCPDTNEILFYLPSTLGLIVDSEEYTDIFRYKIKEEGIGLIVDLYLAQELPQIETESLFVEIDPTIISTIEGRTGEYVKIPNYFVNIAILILILALGYLLLIKYYKKLSKEYAEAKLKEARKV